MKRSALLSLLTILLLGASALPAAAQLVSVHPPTTQPSTEIFDVEILLDPLGESIMGVEVTIGFDENIVSLLEILPGGWFTTPPADQYFFWDYTHPGTELIHFTGSSLGQALGVGGTLAICRFKPSRPASAPSISWAWTCATARTTGSTPNTAAATASSSTMPWTSIRTPWRPSRPCTARRPRADRGCSLAIMDYIIRN